MEDELAVEIENEPAEQVDEGTTPEPEADIEGETPPEKADDEGVEITIEGEAPAPEEDEFQGKAPAWVKDLRKTSREQARRIRELEAERQAASQPKPVELGKKPTLADCEYDEAKFDADLTAWHEKKRAVDAKAAEQEKQTKDAQAAWQKTLENYGQAKAKLRVVDFEDAEHAATEVLSQVQQGVILDGAKDPALLIYALGKNPKKAKELAAITNPVKFAFAVAELESKVSITPRKAPPAPESLPRGGASVTGADSTANRLLEKAQKTGDMSEYRAYMSKKRAQSK